MLKNLRKSEKGFTIIEVLIVLAIAGLILLVVFLAVPALQRNSRNTQRKSDVASLLGAYAEYINNNGGALPTTAAQITANWKPGFYAAADVTLGSGNTAIATPNANTVYINTGAKCTGPAGNFGGTGATTRSVAVLYSIEAASATTLQCTES